MSCGGGEDDRWTCGKAGVAVNLLRVSSIVRDIGEPCVSQSTIKVSVPVRLFKHQTQYSSFLPVCFFGLLL